MQMSSYSHTDTVNSLSVVLSEDLHQNSAGSGSLLRYFGPTCGNPTASEMSKKSDLSATPTPSSLSRVRCAQTLRELCDPLPLIDSDLTRCQQFFSRFSGMDVRALSIIGSDEFFLFMDLRAENEWATFRMTPRKWVHATEEFNKRLEIQNHAKGLPTIAKNPRALIDKLGEVEPKIISRLIRKDYSCESSGYDLLNISLTFHLPQRASETISGFYRVLDETLSQCCPWKECDRAC